MIAFLWFLFLLQHGLGVELSLEAAAFYFAAAAEKV
jgi:hypothetical protein